MMKKTILIFSLLIFSLGLSAQTWSRYGIRVGLDPTNVVVTDFERVGNSVHFYAGVTNLGTLWDGAGTALVAATGRTSLGATTVGEAFFMLTNPSAITFVRINADNSITALSDANFRTALSLNNLTNKAQVELEDSSLMAGGYMSYADGLAGLALKLNKADSALMAGGYFSYSDGLLKANTASPTFTGTVTIPTPFTLGATSVTANGTELNVLDGIPGTLTATEIGYSDGVTSAIQTQLNAINAELDDTISLETIVTLQSDTVPLFVFGAGGGNEADTALFTTSTLYGSFFNKGSDSLIITELRAVMLAGTTPLGTDTLSVQIYWNDTINKTGVSSVSINTNPLGINSVTVGTVDASFNNSTIPPNVWVFCKTPGVVTGRKPNYLSITLSGHKINRKY